MSRYTIIVLAAAALSVPLSSCVSNLEPLNVTNFYLLVPTGGTCGVGSGTIGETSGLLDLALPQKIVPASGASAGDLPGFMVGVEVTSQLLTNVYMPSSSVGGNPQMVVDSMQVQLTTLVAKYQFVSATPDVTVPELPPVAFPVSAVIPVGQSYTFNAQILSGDYGNKLAQAGLEGTLIVDLAFSGETVSGQSISVTPATFTVNVCNGCLMNADQTEALFGGTTCPLEDVESPCGPDTAGQPDGLICSATTVNTPTTPASP